ncbi:MAG: hypothetical protein GY937_17690 [bacterium]|nr:hypothetical protein [bacterium]
MSLAELLALTWAVGGGMLAPGLALVRWLRLGSGPLERLVLALAFGRILLGLVTLAATSAGASALLLGWAPFAVALLALVIWRVPLATGRSGDGFRELGWMAPALGLGFLASALLVHATVGHSGIVDGAGRLIFFGRDTTFDPLSHVAATLQLIDTGLPMNLMHVAGTEFTNSYLPFAERAGIRLLSGLSLLDLTFRFLPLLEVFGLSATAALLVRALGGSRIAATGAAVLTVSGSGAPFLLRVVGWIFGFEPAGLDSWTFFGPYVLPFNSITPALQTAFAASLLLLRLQPGQTRVPAAAGLMVAALFELKLFLWATVFGALLVVTLFAAPTILRRGLRLTAGWASLLVLPSLVEKLYWAWRLSADGGRQGFGVCLGCIPRYFAEGALGRDLLPFSSFDRFHNTALLHEPGLAATTVAAAVGMFAIALGARLFALPELWRRSKATGASIEEGTRVALHRTVAIAAGFGFAATCILKNSPHHLNVTQFTWIASFGLWPFVALVLGRWVVEQRWLAISLLLLLALLSTGRVLGPLGYGAKVKTVVGQDERDLLERLRVLSQPDDVVLEPSILLQRDVPSPVTWVSGRTVYLTGRSSTAALTREEARARVSRIAAVYTGSDRNAALTAIAESGAEWVYAPVRAPLPFPAGEPLEVALQNAAGIVYRVGP